MQHQKIADMTSSCGTAALGAVGTSGNGSSSSATCAGTDDAGLDPDEIQALQHQDKSAVPLRQAAAAAASSTAATAAAASCMQLISTTAPQNAMAPDWDKFGEYCINLPVADKAQLSAALICDTLNTIPVPPKAVTQIQGPVLEVHQVDDHSVDVKIVHGFRATYDEPIADVRKRAETYLLQQHAAEAAAAAASQQQKAPVVAEQGQGRAQTAEAEATAAAEYAGPSHNVGHQQQDNMHPHPEQHQLHRHSDHYSDHSGLGCVCRELHEGEEGLIPDYIKRTADCVVHEGTDSEYASSQPATLSSSSGGPSMSNLNEPVPASPAKGAVGSAAGAGSPFAASPFQAGNLEPFSLPSSRRPVLQQQQQLSDVAGQPPRHPYKQQQERQDEHNVRMQADNAAVLHGGRRLSVEVLRTADHSADGVRGSSSAAAQPTAVHSVDTTSDSSHASGHLDNHNSSPLPGQQQQPLISSPGSSSTAADGVPSRVGAVAVAPGPAVGQDWQQQQPVLVTLRHRKTAHGHQQIDVQPLQTADPVECQQQIEQQQGSDSNIRPTDIEQKQQDATHQQRLQDVLLQQQQQQQQYQYQNTMTQLDMNILHPPKGFLPLSGGQAHQAQQHQMQQQEQQQAWGQVQGLALVPTPQNPPPTLMMPRPSIQGKQPPRAQPREGFVPRCEWELDPRKVLVGRCLAVGGFAEVFIGKYEGTVVAVKRLLTGDASTIERFVSEVRMLARLRHPNLILFMGYCTMPELCIIIEYMNKGSLYSILHSPEQRKQRLLVAKEHQKQQQEIAAATRAADPAVASSSHSSNADTSAASSGVTGTNGSSTSSKQMQGALSMGMELLPELSPAEEEKAQMEGLDPKLQRLVAIAVARGMAYLHTRNPPILHLDLKSPNILVDDRWRVKITDFGLSRARQRTFVSSTAQGGTPEWMAPEVLRCEAVAEPADVYSYGVVLWELITGRAPWENYNAMQVVAIVGFRELSVPLPATAADPFLLELCKRCLQRDPAARPTFPQIAALLDQHYGPPTWSSHAQPLMPHTPRPALPAPPAAATQGQLVMRQWQQQQQREKEWAREEQKQRAQQAKHTDEKEEDSVRDGADVKVPARQANAEQQQQPPGAAAAEQQPGKDAPLHQQQRDHLDVQVHVMPVKQQQQQQQQQEDDKGSSHGPGSEQLPAAGGSAAAVPVQRTPLAASPFAANLAPWSYESVLSMADEAAAAQQHLPSSSTASDSSRWASISNLRQQQQSGSLAVNRIGSSAAVGGASAQPYKGDSSSVQSEVHIAADDVQQGPAQEQQEQRQTSLAQGPACSALSAAVSCELTAGPECLNAPMNVGASAGAAAPDPAQCQQQQHPQQVCGAQRQLKVPSVAGGAAAGRTSWEAFRETPSGPLDSAEAVVAAATAAAGAAAAASRTDPIPEPHAAGDHLDEDSTGIPGSVDRHVLLDHLQPHMQAFLAAAAAAAGPGGDPGIPGSSGPSSAPAGQVAHDTAAWHALLEAAASISSFHGRNNSISSGYGGYLRSEGSYALLRGLWPTMTEASFNSLMSRTASRQVSRSSEREGSPREGSNNRSSIPDGCNSGCSTAADDSSGGCQASRQDSRSDDGQVTGATLAAESSRTQDGCNSNSSGYNVAADGSSAGCQLIAESAAGEADPQQQQQQHGQPDAPASDAVISDCSRSSSPDTSRSHLPQGQDSFSQLVYQVWPVMVAPTGGAAVASAVADATADVTAPLDIQAMLCASVPAAMVKRATKNGRGSPAAAVAAAAPNGVVRSASDSAMKQLGVKQFGGPRSGSANGIAPDVAAAKQYGANVGVVDCDVNALSSDVCAALQRQRQWEPQEQVADIQPAVCQQQQQQQSACDTLREPPAAAKHVLNYSMQQPNRGHSVDASILRHAAQHSSSTGGSSYQKGRFMVSTTAAPATATPPKARGTSSGRNSQRSSHSNLAAVDFAAATAAVTPGSAVQQQQQQPAKQVVSSGPRSVPYSFRLQQQQEPGVRTDAAPGAVAAVSTAAAASVAAMCSADLSLNLMSAFACPSANVAQDAHEFSAAPTSVGSAAVAVPPISALPAVAVTAEGPAQQHIAEVAECSVVGKVPTTDNSSRGLAPKGVWGSGVDHSGSSLAAADQSLRCVNATPASPLQQSLSSTCSRDSFSCYHQQRLRGCSSPGSVSASSRTALAAAGRVDGPLSQPAPSTQLLQMHFSTGGLCYRTGRFSVTVQQQEVQQGSGATSPVGSITVSSSTAAQATAAADVPVSAVVSPTVVTLGPLSPAGGVFRTISALGDRQRPSDAQQRGIMHPSASCGALSLLAAQQELSPSQSSVMPQYLAADAAAMTGGSVATVTAAAAGTVSHPLDGEMSMSTCSYVSIESDHGVHTQQQQQHVVPGHTGPPAKAEAKQQQQQQQVGSTSPLHQRRLLAQPPAQLLVPAPDDLELVSCAHPLPLQQQLLQQAPAVGPHTSSSSSYAAATSCPTRTSDPSHSTQSSMLSVDRTVSSSSSSAVWSPRSTPAAPCSLIKPAAKPPLVPLVSKTPSPNATPLHSPRPKAAAVTRDYCRGRFQVHECPLIGPWQACRSTSSSLCSACAPITPAVDVCGLCPTPVADAGAPVVESAAVPCLQQQQQPGPSAMPAAQMGGSRVSPLPALGALCPTNAAAAPLSGTVEAATVKKMGRFTVKHESSSSLGHCVSRAGSTASSTQASRSGSPRGDHPIHLSRLGSSRYSASASCDRLSACAATPITATPTAGGSAGKGMYRSTSDLARQQQQHGEKQQQQQRVSPVPVLKKACAVGSSKLETSSHNSVELVNSSARSSSACDAAAAPVMSAVVPAASAPATASAAVVPATSAPAIAMSAATPATLAPPQLAPIRTVSKKGRFVVTQTTPGSTACSTPKSGIPLAPAAASCRSASSSFTAFSSAISAAGACSKTGSASDPAAAAAAWLNAAAASGAADAAAAALVITCPVCDAPHAVCAAAQSAAGAAPCAALATAASHRPRSPLPPASPVAAAAAFKSGGKAAAVSGAATTCPRTSSVAISPGKPSRSSNSCINYKLCSPSNTPRAHSPLPTCSSCGAPLPPVGPSFAAAMEPAAAIAAVLGAPSHRHFTAVGGLVEGEQTAAGDDVTGAGGAVPYAAVQPSDVFQNTVPCGLLAEAVTRVLAARQQEQLAGIVSPECSSINLASGTALGNGADASSARSSDSSIGGTAAPAAPAAAGSIAVAALPGRVDGGARQVGMVIPLPAWQLPQSHALQCAAQSITELGSNSSNYHGSNCSSPVSSLVLSGDNASAAAAFSPWKVLTQQPGLPDVGASCVPDLGSAAQQSQTAISVVTKSWIDQTSDPPAVMLPGFNEVSVAPVVPAVAAASYTSSAEPISKSAASPLAVLGCLEPTLLPVVSSRSVTAAAADVDAELPAAPPSSSCSSSSG